MSDANRGTTIPADAASGASTAGRALLSATQPLGLLSQARSRVTAHGFALVVAIAGAAVFAGQLVEDLADAAPLQMLPPDPSVKRWTVIAVVLYMLFIVEVVRREARDGLAALRPVVQIDEARFQAYTRRMSGRDTRLELLRLAISGLLVTLLYPVLGWPLPTTNDPVSGESQFLPASAPAALLVVIAYTVVGWVGLRLVSTTIRLARALGQLTRESVTVNVFDITHLLPFGRIALAGSLAPAGLIGIFLVGLGQPATLLGWTVLLLATSTSILALVLPLRGIHRQMRRAKDEALTGLNRQLTEVYAHVDGAAAIEPARMGELKDRADLLVSLRRVVGEMPTWPFRDTVAFGRAVLIASAPLIYTALNGMVDALVVRKIVP